MSKKVVVTGGAGFIGSHLAEALLTAGYGVSVIDNFATGKRERIPAGVIFSETDISDYEKLLTLFRGVDTVFHEAAIPKVPYSIEHPEETHRANIEGTFSVLRAAKDAGVHRVVYAASSSVYGEQAIFPLHEELVPAPLHPYGVQKHVGELYAFAWSKVYGLETVSLRYFNVYGPHQDPEGPYAGVIAKFMQSRYEGKKLPIIGDGTQTRDFTHVSDVVRANILAMESDHVGKGESINIGGGKSITILELAKLIGGELEFLPSRPEAKHSLASIEKAKRLLGWEPKVTIEAGLEDLKKYYGN